MLERIRDINPNLNYKKENGNLINSSPVGNYTVKGNLNDTITFSSAALFLNNINWHLKELRINESDKISVRFVVDNIEFKTDIELFNHLNYEYQKYEVSKDIEGINEIKKSMIFISINLNEIYKTKNINYELKTFHSLFNRFLDYIIQTGLINQNKNELKDNIIFENDYSFQLITDGLIPSLIVELSNITNSLFEFIDRLGYKINFENKKMEHLAQRNDQENKEILIIDKILVK